MSELDDAMRKHINYVVFEERRPFSFVDFFKFKVDGKEYTMSHGTFRNKVSKMKKAGEIEVVCYSPQAFYTLKGVAFAKPMTGNHTGVPSSSSPLFRQQQPHLKNDPVYRLIQNLPLDKRALHDIHLRFEVKGIWSLISTSNSALSQPDSYSKDIRLKTWTFEDLDITATMHFTDTVSITVGCSYAPIAVDIAGVIRLSNALAVVEERLSKLIDYDAKEGAQYSSFVIPPHMSWTVTMWHFGADASITYSGEKFNDSWEIAQHALITAYSKDWKDGKRRIRIERQEYPKKSLAEALSEKLDAVGGGQHNNE